MQAMSDALPLLRMTRRRCIRRVCGLVLTVCRCAELASVSKSALIE